MGAFRLGSDRDIALDEKELTHRDLTSRIDDLDLPNFIDLVHIQRVESQDLLPLITRVRKRFMGINRSPHSSTLLMLQPSSL